MKSTVLTAALVAVATPAWASDLAMRLTCGGVGSDERHAMEAQGEASNLSLELFVAPGGEYVADVDVTLRPLASPGSVVSVHSEGPVCYLRVPPGRYRIEATYEGITRSAQANVPAAPRRPVRVALAFPKSVGDRQSDAASPEEKEQAAKRP